MQVPVWDSQLVRKPSLETGRQSKDWLQNYPAIRDERHEEAQDATQDQGSDLAILQVHPDEDAAFDGKYRGSQDRHARLPMESGGNDETDGADELHEAQARPGFSW